MKDLARLFASVVKETRIIVRDKQALFLFFVMPVLFVLILSLALRDAFGARPGATFPVLLVDADHGVVGRVIAESFHSNPHVKLTRLDAVPESQVRHWVLEGRYVFCVIVPAKATELARRRMGEIAAEVPPDLMQEPLVKVHTLADPSLRGDYRQVLEGEVSLALHGVEMKLAHDQLVATLHATLGKKFVPPPEPESLQLFAPVQSEPLTGGNGRAIPTSVQQNAPAWTLLAMFFLTVPLSVSFIREREQGSLFRLQTMTAPAWVVLGGKAVPFFVINQIQMLSILAVSVYVLPLLGGDQLDLGQSPAAILLLGGAASLAAIGFGIVVAMYARTAEQATSFSSATIMIMAALGGILVPKAVMPPFMQHLAVISPLSWGLDGFLNVFVRGGGIPQVLPEAAGLLAFSALCHGIAILRYERRI